MSDGERPAWGWPHLVGVFLLGQAVPVLAVQGLLAAGFFAWLYGPDLPALAMTEGDGSALARGRLMIWGVCLALPVQVGAAVSLLRDGGATLEDMGLTWRGAAWSLLAALGLAVVLIPAVYAMQAVALWLAGPADDHVFTKMARGGLTGVEWGLLLFAACVAAPVWEELLYRGMVQTWAETRRPEGGLTCMAMALAAAVAWRTPLFLAGETFTARLAAMAPAFWVLGLALPFALIWRGRVGGVWASAALFAFVHTGVWPTPVPLFALALGLGWLMARWRTLAGPVLLHALFNAAACAALIHEVTR